MNAGRKDDSTINGTVSFFLERTLQANGFEKVERVPYWVLLSKLDGDKMNKVELLSPESEVVYTCRDMEPEPSEGGTIGVERAYSPYGYSVPGQAQTTESVIYANRCLPDDLDYLDAISIYYWGHILLCRYGPTESPGLAVYTAQKRGSRGVIFFPDREDVAGKATTFYPSTWWMPGGAIRRAQVRRDQDIGDPSTPGYASSGRGVYRIPLNETLLPTIPVQPIGYEDATMIMRKMIGKECPEKWLPHLDAGCTIGDMTTHKIRLTSATRLRKLGIDNVIGYLLGTVEPDRYVVFGVPMDSLTAGALTPGTALSQFLELGRLLAGQYKTWKPRRTVVLAAWDAQQFGHIGATEYIEGTRHKIATRTVAYINTDICTSGPEFAVSGSPMFTKSFASATTWVKQWSMAPRLYEGFRKSPVLAEAISGEPGFPMLRRQGSFLPFVDIAGVPSLDVAFGNNVSKGIYYPAMGTAYDTVHLLTQFVDKGLKVNQMCTELLATLIRQWSDTPILPYDLDGLNNVLHAELSELSKEYEEKVAQKGISFDAIHTATMEFKDMVEAFVKVRDAVDIHNPYKVRMFNDKMMGVERNFIHEVRKDARKSSIRNVVFGLSDSNQERMVAFPILRDMLQEIGSGVEDVEGRLAEMVRRHVSLVAYAIFQAASSLDTNSIF